MEEENIGAKFVATYYRLLFRSPQMITKLYDQHATIVREGQKNPFQICLLPRYDFNPFKDPDCIVKILSYNSYPAGELRTNGDTTVQAFQSYSFYIHDKTCKDHKA